MFYRVSAKDSDEFLISASQKDNVRAFDQLMIRYQKRLYYFVYKKTLNKEDAEDIVQESFLRAFSSISSFKGSSLFFTWLCAIAKNKMIDSGKTEKAKINKKLFSIDALESNDDEETKYVQIADGKEIPIENVTYNSQEDCVNAKITLLPDKLREVMFLLKGEFSYKDISQAYDIPYEQVKKVVFRARNVLANKYNIKECFN